MKQTYRLATISLYHEDLERIDQTVQALKAKGVSRANRSALLRAAFAQMDVAKAGEWIQNEKA